MSKTDEGRRSFLIGAAVGGAVVAGAALVRETIESPAQEDAVAGAPHGAPHDTNLGAFFNAADAAAIAALAERIMPGAPGMPGASDAGVLDYIDLALAGAYAPLRDFYRRGLAQLDAYCRRKSGAPFVALSEAQQDEIVAALEDGSAAGFSYPGARTFFVTLRTHTMEGMFADPVYGGNKDFAGWRLVGFPGAQPAFSPEDLASREAFAGPSVIGLSATIPNTRRP